MLPKTWIVQEVFTFVERRPGGKLVTQTLEVGDKFRIKGERGWFVFREYVLNEANNAEWVTCIELHGAKEQRGGFRFVRPERVQRKFRVIKRRKSRKKSVAGLDSVPAQA